MHVGLRTGDVAERLGTRRGPAAGLVVMLLSIDAALILFHLSMKYLGHPEEYVFDLGADRSYSEFFQYAKNTWAIMLLGLLLFRRRAAVYGAWALVCGYFLFDDAFQLHERAGMAMVAAVPEWGAAAQHIGELVLMGSVGIVLVAAVFLTHRRASAEDRAVSRLLTVLFAVLILVGVGLDAAHHLLLPQPVFDAPLTTVEDGGELIVLSLVVAFVFAVAICGHRASASTARIADVDPARV